MPLTAIAQKRLYTQVAEQVAALIREGHWKEGERLPAERDLAQQLGVSRPTVREAMIALELMGLVEVRTGAGIYVQNAKPGCVTLFVQDQGPGPFELMAARRIIEGETAAIAAQTIDDVGLADLANAITKMEKDIEKGVQGIANREDGDLLFHNRIARCTDNLVLVSIVDQLWESMRQPMFQAIVELVRLPGNARRAAADHRIILERIQARDAQGARAAMHDHLDQVMSWLMQDGVNGDNESSPAGD